MFLAFQLALPVGIASLLTISPPLDTAAFAQGYGDEAGDEGEEDEGGYGDYGDEDMGEDEEYGDYGGYGGSSRGGASNSPLSQMLASTGLNVEALSKYDVMPLLSPGERVEVKKPSLFEKAKASYQAGNLPVAMNLYFAHMALDPDKAGELLSAAKYSRSLRRPVWHVNFGLSLMVRGSAEGNDLHPILASSSTTGTSSSRFRGMRGGGGGEYGDEGGGEYGDGGGEYGDEGGGYGDGGGEYGMEDEEGGGEYGGGYGDEGPAGRSRSTRVPDEKPAKPKTMLSEEAAERVAEVLGLVADTVREDVARRRSAGDLGGAFTSMKAPAPKPPANRGGFRSPATAPAAPTTVDFDPGDTDLAMWAPGIIYLGEDSSTNTLVAAKKAGLDWLLHFDVGASPFGEDFVQNKSRCRLIHVASGRSVVVSKPCDNVEVERRARAGNPIDPAKYIKRQIANLSEMMDKYVDATPMPSLTREQALKRVASLFSGSQNDLMRSLAEVRMYQRQGLLTDADVEDAFQLIAGDDGLVLLYGSQEDKVITAHRLAGVQ
ncbi:MAG: hypothetical protein AAGA03_11690 [Planctomycetota bacterium]